LFGTILAIYYFFFTLKNELTPNHPNSNATPPANSTFLNPACPV
jgi:hypothetical protein